MPLYNKADQILGSINSVLAQSVTDWELVVVDDGSQDGSAELVRELGDPRIHVHTQANQGVSVARNRGIQLASTDLIAFLDADDEWHPEYLASVLSLARDVPEAALYATGYQIRHPREGIFNSRLRGIPNGFSRGILEGYFRVAMQSDPPVFSSAVLVRRHALEAIGGFPVGVESGEDLLTWARLAARYTLAYDVRTLVIFHVSGHVRRPDPNERVTAGLRALLASFPQTVGLRAYLGLWCRMQAVMAMRSAETAFARHCAWLAVYYGPLQWRNAYTFLLAWLPDEWRGSIDQAARRLAYRQRTFD